MDFPEVLDTDELRISFGFQPGKSTRNFDLDNLSYIQKILIDCFSLVTGVNDSYRHITEVRTKVLPKQEEECLYVQIEVTNREEVVEEEEAIDLLSHNDAITDEKITDK